MAGTLNSVRGSVAVAWAWNGAAVALNASLPANVAGTISVPVAGLANAVVTEGGVAVWRGGAFVPGPAGLYGAALDGAYVTFAVGSGQYAFAAAPAATSASGFSPTGCTGQALACAAPGARIAAVKRAGLAAGAPSGGAPWARRYLVAHVVEAACVGRADCVVPSAADVAAAVAPAVVLRKEEVAMQVCVEALCA
jgi:hypothetical protein